MAKERLYLFDTTLRDGQQTPGIDFSLEDKILVARMLDGLGIDYVEGGYPGANPTDTAFFAERRTKRARFTAFGMTRRAGRSAATPPSESRPAERSLCRTTRPRGARPRHSRRQREGVHGSYPRRRDRPAAGPERDHRRQGWTPR